MKSETPDYLIVDSEGNVQRVPTVLDEDFELHTVWRHTDWAGLVRVLPHQPEIGREHF